MKREMREMQPKLDPTKYINNSNHNVLENVTRWEVYIVILYIAFLSNLGK